MRRIDADSIRTKLIKKRDRVAKACGWLDEYVRGLSDAIATIDEQPTIDAEPVKHGHWIVGAMQPHATCSVCRHWFSLYQLTNYCPNCGALMREDK